MVQRADRASPPPPTLLDYQTFWRSQDRESLQRLALTITCSSMTRENFAHYSSVRVTEEEMSRYLNLLCRIRPFLVFRAMHFMLDRIVVGGSYDHDTPDYSPRELAKLEALSEQFEWAASHAESFHKRSRIKEERAIHIIQRLHAYRDSHDGLDVGVLVPGLFAIKENERIRFGAHAVVYGVEKEAGSDRYRFSVWNAGYGIHEDDHHYYGFFKEKIYQRDDQLLYQTRACWSGLTFEQVVSDELWHKLCEAPSQPYSKEDNIYTVIVDHFGRAQDPRSLSRSDFHHPQVNRNCGGKSAWAAGRDKLGEPYLARKVKADLTACIHEQLEKAPGEREPFDIRLINMIQEVAWLRGMKLLTLFPPR